MFIRISVFLFFALTSTAYAQGSKTVLFPTAFECLPTVEVKDDLTQKYGEEPVAIGKAVVRSMPKGLVHHGNMMIWVSAKTSTWSITITPVEDPETTCFVTHGTDYIEMTTGIKTKI